ncbi:pirin family protein [Leucobacter sp. W1153]|uniref:pirin family protein n=1 Tax=Leucobacter sp. W1153 TaxID=3439064 RepID=UPI003F35247B
MSNLEPRPEETICDEQADGPGGQITLFNPRDVPLGGLRAMNVRRTLPQRGRTLIGAWCFLDHYGPDDVAVSGGMNVPAHPHTGLQTASWLFSGTIEHRDSSGVHALVRPGELNLMTAGSGISHSERSTSDTTLLHGVQLWIALPDHARNVARGFEHFVPPVRTGPGWAAQVFLGTLLGDTSPVGTHSPLVGAELNLLPGAVLELSVDPGFEHGLLLDHGTLTVASVASGPGEQVHSVFRDSVGTPGGGSGSDVPVPRDSLAFVSAGTDCLRLVAGDDGARVILIGGAPFGEQLVMWWNFVARTHEEIVAARGAWHAEIDTAAESPTEPGPRHASEPPFGLPDDEPEPPLPAPALPIARLKPRD